METRIPITNNHHKSLTVVVEPWAEELILDYNESCEVIFSIDLDRLVKISINYCEYGLIIWPEEPGIELDFKLRKI